MQHIGAMRLCVCEFTAGDPACFSSEETGLRRNCGQTQVPPHHACTTREQHVREQPMQAEAHAHILLRYCAIRSEAM